MAALLANTDACNNALGNFIGGAAQGFGKTAALNNLTAPALQHASLLFSFGLFDGHAQSVFQGQAGLNQNRLLLQQ